jgi:hypothetical protein
VRRERNNVDHAILIFLVVVVVGAGLFTWWFLAGIRLG